MTVAPQADIEIVTGQVQGIVQKAADKWQIEVSTGGQNPRRLWTKDQGLVQTMMGMIGQTLAFQCGKSHWTMNDGTPVTSLWINGYGAPGAQAPVIQQPQFQQQPVQQPTVVQPVVTPMGVTQQPMQAPVQQDTTEQKIHRQTATKVAVHLLKHLAPENQTFENLLKISERLVAYYDTGVHWTAPIANPDDGDPGPEQPGLSQADDQIPF
jgi:hypothetical protein